MGIRALFASFGLDLSGSAADLRAAHRARGVRRGHRRHHGWRRWLPARRTAPDRPGPGAARRRRDAGGLAAPPAASPALVAHRSPGAAAMALGLFTDVPARRLGARCAAILAVLLGVAAVSPVISAAVPARSPGPATPRVVRQRRQPGRPELPAQPAAHHGHRLGADDRARPGLHDGDRRRLGEGERGQVDRGQLRRRLRRQQRLRRSRSAPPIAADMAQVAGRRAGDPPALRPAELRRRADSAVARDRPGGRSSTRCGSTMVDGQPGRPRATAPCWSSRTPGPRTTGLGVGDTVTAEVPAGEQTLPGRRRLRRQPDHRACPCSRRSTTLTRGRVPRDADNFLIINTDRERPGMQDALEAVVAGPADRHRQGRGRVRRGAARADRPAGADDLRACSAWPW